MTAPAILSTSLALLTLYICSFVPHWVVSKLTQIVDFRKMKELRVTEVQLRNALWMSDEVVLSADGSGARPRWSIKEYSKERINNSKMRLKFLPTDAEEEDVQRFLEGHGIMPHRLTLYRNADQSLNGSGVFVVFSEEEATRLDEKFRDDKLRWNGVEILLERDKTHAKSPSGSPKYEFEDVDVGESMSLDHHRFLEDCKRQFREAWPLLECKTQAFTNQGPFRHTITIHPGPAFPGLTRMMSFKGAMLTVKKPSIRSAELKVARFLHHLLLPNVPHPLPLTDMQQVDNKDDEDSAAILERLSRIGETKRLQQVYRELVPHNMNHYADIPGPLISSIGGSRRWTNTERKLFMSALKTQRQLLEKVESSGKQRQEELNNRGFTDFVRPIIPDVVKAKDDDSSDDESSSDEEADDDIEDEMAGQNDISALEQFEIKVPATKLQVGYFSTPQQMNVLWQTSTQLSVAFEELTPRVNVRFSRHNVEYQMRNLLKNVSDVMWIETDLGLNAKPRSPTPQASPSLGSPSTPPARINETTSSEHSTTTTYLVTDTSATSTTQVQETTSKPDAPMNPNASAPMTGDTTSPSYLDLFIPLDSAPRLSLQQHFQRHKVGALDFTIDGTFGRMTLIRLHFDLKTLSTEDTVSLLSMCKILTEIGLLRTRMSVPPLKFAPILSQPDGIANPNMDHAVKARTNIELGKDAPYSPPNRLGEVDHWVRWKLACLVTQNKLVIGQVTEEVVDLLLSYRRTIVFRVLEKMEAKGGRLFNFARRLERDLSGYPKGEHAIGEHFTLKREYALVAHVVVTPMEIRCEGPLPEVSNRLLRNFAPLQERFVRVSFRAGYSGGLTGPSMRNVGKMAVRDRIGTLLLHGMTIPALKDLFELPARTNMSSYASVTSQPGLDYTAFSHFEFLLSSPSQLRTQKAWMYCPPTHAPPGFVLPTSVSGIRKWLGDFEGIFNVAMFSARLGQGLSSTFHCFDVDPSWIRRVAEVTSNGYMFSDGCASMSLSIAKRAAEALNLHYIPSAVQIRLAGIKGMLSLDPTLEGDVICVRPSMEKFAAPQHSAFEVVTWARPLKAHLNKQIIQILSALGLPDKNLIDVQTAAFEKIAVSTFPSSFASEEARTKRIDELERAWGGSVKKGSLESRAVSMLRSGFELQKEPYLKSILTAIGLRSLQEIHSMARIPITNGRYAIGIMDELGVLEPGQIYFRMSELNDRTKLRTHTGLLCLSRSPCLHPGDARFVEAVDRPELEHLVDVVVFPRKGARPIPDECSGGDLDGDQYLILWGEEFIPPTRDTPAFKHESSATASKSSKDDNEVYPQELVDFFVNYLFDDKLSQIADAHTFWADKSDVGVFDEKCLRLAEAHGIAVDAPKTGKVVKPMDELRVSAWPDFMNVNKAGCYLSKKVLGVLFRRSSEEFATLANSSNWESSSSDHSFFDEDMIVPGYEAYIEQAIQARDSYFEQLSVNMQLFRLHDEASAVTGETLYRFRSERREWESKKEGFDFASDDLKTRFKALFESQSSAEAPHSGPTSSSTDSSTTLSGISLQATDDVPTTDTDAAPIQCPSSTSPRSWSTSQLQLASAWYIATYSPKHRKDSTMWSFPWLVSDILCEIKRQSAAKRLPVSEPQPLLDVGDYTQHTVHPIQVESTSTSTDQSTSAATAESAPTSASTNL